MDRSQGWCHRVALPFTFLKKKYLKSKEELWKFKYFTMQKYNLQKKNPPKETKILHDIITLQLISRFQHKPKYHLSKILI
jgi:hypothetical protein